MDLPMKLLYLASILVITATVFGQEPIDPAFDPPLSPPGSTGGGVRWNGTLGMVIINGKVYQQFGLRPDIPFGKFGIGLDLTFRFDPDGNFKDDEWNDARDYLEKLYYFRYGLPGDPLYVRVGALDHVTLGYGIIMRRYANTIQYPEIKRIGVYTEGSAGRVGWQGMLNNIGELDEPGLMAGRLSYDTGLKGLTVGATFAHDGNQFAGLVDDDNDGIPNRLDLFFDRNDFTLQRQLLDAFRNDPALLEYMISNGFLPDIRDSLHSYKDMKESVTIFGADIGIPVWRGRPISIWTYAQAAKIADYGWGWAFPGLRTVIGPVEIGWEYRQYEKQFRGEFFNFAYEIERAQLLHDTVFVTKEKTLENLGRARGWYADAMVSAGNFGYAFAWYQDMRGENYETGKTFYGEVGITPPMINRLQKVAGYYMQPNVKSLFEGFTEGTIYGGKVYLGLAQNVSLVYDHRITYYNGESHRTVRIETMVTF
ncbi:hypothetical protein EHM69_11385 [candidate division KSB1 bacterium]|nr:MAG: hypothetical protein EHM69_11385 [candidate division KSB1 bacterium]